MLKLTDIVFNTSFYKYFVNAVAELSALVNSGVVSADAAITAIAQSAGFGGKTVNLPFWNDIMTDDEVLSDSGNMDPKKINAGQDIGVIFRRGNLFKSSDLAADIAGDDPMKALATMLAKYWSRKQQKTIFSMLKGIFADNVANDNGDLVLDISQEVGDDAILARNTLLYAAQLLGDAKNNLSALAMNSQAETVLNDIGGTLFKSGGETPAQLASYNGRSIIVDDGVHYEAATGIADIYLFGAGAIALNDVPTKMPFEVGRDIPASADQLASRMSYIAHVRGFAWQSPAIAGASPTNAEIEAAAAWDRVYGRKQVRVCKLRCKLA